MANTYTEIHIQVVFATQFRDASISPKWESRLYEYIIAIIQNNKHKILAINGMPDHIHILIGLRPDEGLSELIQKVKASSSKWINDEKLTAKKFSWQQGYSSFSYTKSHIPKVIQYIQNQKNHHSKASFIEEYHKILKGFKIEFDPKYIFKLPE